MGLDQVLLLGSVVLLASIGAARLGARFGLPSLLLFLGLGVLVGELGVDFNDAGLAHSLGFAALVLILVEGGFTTRWVEIRGALPAAILLATVGVGRLGGCSWRRSRTSCWGCDPASAVLLGAITSPTDAAAIFSVLRKVPLPAQLRATIEAESGFNDAPIVLLVATATAWSLGEGLEGGPVGMVLIILLELVGGAVVGAALGWLGVQVLRSIALPASGLYPLAAIGWAVLAYGAGQLAAPVRVRGRVRVRPGARQRRTAAPARHPIVRRGSRLDRPDRPVRHARHAGRSAAGLVGLRWSPGSRPARS